LTPRKGNLSLIKKPLFNPPKKSPLFQKKPCPRKKIQSKEKLGKRELGSLVSPNVKTRGIDLPWGKRISQGLGLTPEKEF